MHGNLTYFVIHWGIMSLSLWVASFVFNGIRFSDTSSLLVSALLLGFANAILRPVLVVLTLPLTVVTLGILRSHPVLAARLPPVRPEPSSAALDANTPVLAAPNSACVAMAAEDAAA